MADNELTSLTLPVRGMVTPECADRLQCTLSGIPGVREARVCLIEDRADLLYDPERVHLVDFEQVINRLGFCLPCSEVVLSLNLSNNPLDRLNQSAAAIRALEGLPGVLMAGLDNLRGQMRVQYVQRVLLPSDLLDRLKGEGITSSLEED